MDIQKLLEASSRKHSHLCPRQVLGIRVGLAGLGALGFTSDDVNRKHLLAIAETDGCFIDGLIAATGCEFGHRTLRVEDYGKIAATFIDAKTERAYRITPALDVRKKSYAYAPSELRHYFAQLQAYQVMPDNELLSIQEVRLNQPISQIISRPGMRVTCALCGEEIINKREIELGGQSLCRACAGNAYYQGTSLEAALSVTSHHGAITFPV
jgi:formylmethanofuran dehydrogenase subunit E